MHKCQRNFGLEFTNRLVQVLKCMLFNIVYVTKRKLLAIGIDVLKIAMNTNSPMYTFGGSMEIY